MISKYARPLLGRPLLGRPLLAILACVCVLSVAVGQQGDQSDENRKKRRQEDARERTESLAKTARRLCVGPGSVIADIGAGNGRDSWTFAEIVGPNGKVFAEEIEKDKTKGIEQEANKRELAQVQAVLGTATDPSLPAGTVDMAYMNRVYHHFTEPRKMLQGIWRALKPGGYLVIVGQRLGTLTDWVPRADRANKHYWIAETTVVREAREQGYLFVEYAEEDWEAKNQFVLIFQRPTDLGAPDRDPDPALPLPAELVKQLLPSADKARQRIALIALGEGRKLIGSMLEAVPCAAIDIVLEEWATQKDERPPLPEGVKLSSVLTEKGDPKLGPEPLDAVYFLDTYHLLFHAPVLLARLRERLAPSGCLYILDRRTSKPISHREASHRRMIALKTVKEEMSQAGFTLLREMPDPTADRFLLVFAKSDAAAADAE
jgi:SAM-dependent methyltransferase